MNYIVRITSQALHVLRNMPKVAFASAGVIAVLIAGVSYVLAQDTASPVRAHLQPDESGNHGNVLLRTVRPTLISGSSSVILLGTVLSNETANIYPRRDGIVEDVYVDIGDTVKKGQVVALLLPRGVEGQSAAMIAEKKAGKAQAESDLATTAQVARETLINTRQMINEKQAALLLAEREQQSLLREFAESEAHVSQMGEQAFSAAQSARQLVEWIILGSNSRSGIAISEIDMTSNLGIQDSGNMLRHDMVSRFNLLSSAEQEYLRATASRKAATMDQVLLAALDTLSSARALLQYTPAQPSANGISHLSYEQLTERLNKILGAQDMIYKAKENLEDARNRYQILVASEPDLHRAYRNGSFAAGKSNYVRILEEELRTANNSLVLTEANQEQMIEMKKRQVDIADAMLQSEYAQSGHRQIRSPFSGVVSKRFVSVGEQVMPSAPVFELVDVLTALSRKAKAEIAFGLPEDLIGSLALGDEVSFSLASDGITLHRATVTRVSPQVDNASRTVAIQARIADGISLPANASVRVLMARSAVPTYRLPSTAVKREPERNIVWTIQSRDADPAAVEVDVLSEDGEFAEVVGELSGESVILLDPPEATFRPSPSS